MCLLCVFSLTLCVFIDIETMLCGIFGFDDWKYAIIWDGWPKTSDFIVSYMASYQNISFSCLYFYFNHKWVYIDRWSIHQDSYPVCLCCGAGLLNVSACIVMCVSVCETPQQYTHTCHYFSSVHRFHSIASVRLPPIIIYPLLINRYVFWWW